MVACAPISQSAPSLAALARGARRAFGAADRIASIDVGPGSREVRVVVRRPRTDVDSLLAQWQASLLLQSVHAAACSAGREPERRDTIATAGGARSAADSSMAVPPVTGVDASFATVDPAFRARLASAAGQFGFRVRSLVVLRSGGDAAQIRIESDAPRTLIANTVAIDGALVAPGATCAAIACLRGFFLEADDARGRPFMVIRQVTSLPSGQLAWGGQWVRAGLPYPFPHG
jgi:hypothetical protein